jgi:hypothetical protein
MGFYHTVEQGDDLPGIAREYGFNDYQTIWNAPDNADLKQQRQNPNVLQPGDRVYIPDKKTNGKSVAVGAKHAFKLSGKGPKLRLALVGPDGKPFAKQQVTLNVDGRGEQQLTTDANGRIEAAVEPGARAATLKMGEQTFDLKIGFLDPIDQKSGFYGRLRNMGYLPPAYEDGDPDQIDSKELQLALELFQRDHGLPIDGTDDSQVQARLKEIYGC